MLLAKHPHVIVTCGKRLEVAATDQFLGYGREDPQRPCNANWWGPEGEVTRLGSMGRTGPGPGSTGHGSSACGDKRLTLQALPQPWFPTDNKGSIRALWPRAAATRCLDRRSPTLP